MQKKITIVLCLCLIILGSIIFNAGASNLTQAKGSKTPTPQAPSSGVSVFGNSEIGTYRDQNDANAQSISYFKSTATGSVTDIVAYISGASSGKATAALYAVNGNSPGALLAQSSAVNIGTSYSWVDFQLSTAYTVSLGTTYGLAVMGNVPVNIAIVSGTGQRTGGPGDGAYSNGFANPFGTVWFNDLSGAMSIYATGTTSSTPTATPTPTPTPTQTPTPQAPSSGVSVFGNSEIGTYRDQNDANAQSISYFKSTATGSVTDIVAYISGASSGKATAALYAVNGNSPGALLAQSSAVNIGTSYSWVDFQLSTAYTVSLGTTYGLAVMGNVPVNIAIVSGTGQRTGGPGDGAYSNGFANPFGTVWFNDLSGAMSIYATGTTSSTPTATPTPTPTPTQTPTPQAPSSGVSVFGNSEIGTYRDQNDANAQSISYFKSTATGSVTDIVAYISGASSGKATAALYAVNGNSPGALLAQSSAVNIGTSYSWVDFQLSTAYTVSLGTTYGLAVMGNVPVNIAIVSGTGQRTGGPGDGAYSNGFANPFGTVWFNDLSGAMSIYATGTTSSTPTATPTPTQTPPPMPPPADISTNYAPLSAFFADMNGAASSYASLDYNTLHDGHVSIRSGPDYIRGSREVDAWIKVPAGSHIVFTAWCKTSNFPNSNSYCGIRLGIDFYANSQINGVYNYGEPYSNPYIRDTGVPNDQQNVAGSYNGNIFRLPWGNDWTLLEWDIQVPSQYYAYITTGQSWPYAVLADYPVQINSAAIWFDVQNPTDNAYAWFADPEIYIYP